MSVRGGRSVRALTGVAAVASVLVAPALASADPAPAAPPAPIVADRSAVGTPALTEAFNGYVVGALTSGRLATQAEMDAGMGTNEPFYDEPALTGAEKPGTLLKVQPVDILFSGVKPGKIDAYRIMFVTTGRDGVTPEISTGIVMVPDDGTPADRRKLISYQEANDSVGGYCHPSTQWTGGDPMDGASWSALGPLALMFGKGYAVVISDVGNNGDLEPHGVFAGRYAGHTQLDAIRAATAVDEIGLRTDVPVGLFGVAGGGVGAAFAAESHATYAPELNITATVLEGMVVDQRTFMRTADGSVGSGFAFAALLGLEPKYPEMRIDEKLTPIGKQVADWYRTQCQMPAYFTAPFVPLKTFFTDGRSPADIPEFQHVYDDNLLGGRAPRSKVLIASCAKDDSPMSLVPAQDSRDLAARYRAGGTDVTYAPSDCSTDRFLTDMYGWGTDLFGMQTVDWLDRNVTG
ncbi:lipase family protein [Prescottella subtropica]|uniref:lipase family protein n=1 Tax=Prescottella subtropica TaxID=2545757 RepID=UPI0010F9865A|nr:lipase family protein [Prescottella subtropica]